MGESRAALGSLPIWASSSGWGAAGGFDADLFGAYRAERMRSPANDHIVVTTCLGSSARVAQRRGGEELIGPAMRGESIVILAGEETEWHGRIPTHLRVSLSTRALDEVASEAFGVRAGRLRLRHVMRTADPVFAQVAWLAVRELRTEAHPAQPLVVGALHSLLAGHIVRTSAHVEAPPVARSRAGKAGVRRTIDYIREHPTVSFSLDELAAVAGLSRHHFARVFRAVTGESPVRYVERTRIDYAMLLLASGNLSLSEVAVAVGFSDQSHFTRRFRAYAGLTPGQFRARRRER